MRYEAMKVGELAKRTGLTIRTLHHYDDIGLLKPSLHTESGHRLYTEPDVARLQQIVSLRQLGFTLEQVGECLTKSDFSPLTVIELHLTRLREQIDMQQQLCDRLEAVASVLRAAEKVSAHDFLQTIEVMTMIENYYTPEQLEYLKQRREQVGEERMQQAPNDWSNLYAAFQAELDKGSDPASPQVQELVKRRNALIAEFTGGNTGIEQSLTRLWKDHGSTLSQQYGYNHDPKLVAFMDEAVKAAK